MLGFEVNKNQGEKTAKVYREVIEHGNGYSTWSYLRKFRFGPFQSAPNFSIFELSGYSFLFLG